MTIDETLKVKETRSRPQVGGAPMGGLQVRRPWVIPDNGLTQLGNSLGVLSKSVVGAVDDYQKSEMEQAEKDFNKGIPKEEAVAQASFGSRTVTGLAYDTMEGIQAGKEANFNASNNAMDFAQEIKPSTEEDPRTPGEQASDLYDQEGRSLAKNLKSQTAQDAFLKTWQNNKPNVLSKIGQAYTTNVRMVHTNNAINDITTAILKPSTTDQNGNPATTNNQVVNTLSLYDDINEALGRPSLDLQEKSTIVGTAINAASVEFTFDERNPIKSLDDFELFMKRVTPTINDRSLVTAKDRANFINTLERKFNTLRKAKNSTLRANKENYTDLKIDAEQGIRKFNATGQLPPGYENAAQFADDMFVRFGFNISDEEFTRSTEAADSRTMQALKRNITTRAPITNSGEPHLDGRTIKQPSDLIHLVKKGIINYEDLMVLKDLQKEVRETFEDEYKRNYEAYGDQVGTFYARVYGLPTESGDGETQMMAALLGADDGKASPDGTRLNNPLIKANSQRALQRLAKIHVKQDIIEFLMNNPDLTDAQKLEWIKNITNQTEQQLDAYNKALDAGQKIPGFDGSILFDGTSTAPAVYGAEQVGAALNRTREEVFEDNRKDELQKEIIAQSPEAKASMLHSDTYTYSDYGRPWEIWFGMTGKDIESEAQEKFDVEKADGIKEYKRKESQKQADAAAKENKRKADAAAKENKRKNETKSKIRNDRLDAGLERSAAKQEELREESITLFNERMLEFEFSEAASITDRIARNNIRPLPEMFALDPLDEVAYMQIAEYTNGVGQINPRYHLGLYSPPVSLSSYGKINEVVKRTSLADRETYDVFNNWVKDTSLADDIMDFPLASPY